MEVKCDIKETVKKVSEKVSKISWTINDFIRQSILAGDDPLESERFKIDEEMNINFRLLLFCPSDPGDNSYFLELFPCNFDESASRTLKTECKFWLENSDGDKYAETDVRQHTFIRGGEEENNVQFHDFIDRSDMLRNFPLKDSCAIICGEIKRQILESDFVFPKPETDLREKFWSAYQNGLTNECVFKLDGKEFKISKVILSAHSETYNRIKNTTKKDGTIEISNTKLEVMEAFIEYLHRGEIDNMAELCDDLFVLAGKLKVTKLRSDCIDVMAKTLNKDNLLARFKLSIVYKKDDLKNAVIDHILSPTSDLNFLQLLESDNWINLAATDKTLARELTSAIFDKTKWMPNQIDEVPNKRQRTN